MVYTYLRKIRALDNYYAFTFQLVTILIERMTSTNSSPVVCTMVY